jgi:hypothetical protein
MRAFAVCVNDVPICTAGIPGDGTHSVAMAWADSSRWSPGEAVFLVNGLDARANEHVFWATPSLDIGDCVTIAAIDSDIVDRPSERYAHRAGESYARFLWHFHLRRARAELAALRKSPEAWAAQHARALRRLPAEARRWIRSWFEPHRAVAFRISHNGRLVRTAGLQPPCVVSLCVIWGVVGDLALGVSGLDVQKGEHVKWDMPDLRVGDTLAVELVATDQVDPPARRRAKDG